MEEIKRSNCWDTADNKSGLHTQKNTVYTKTFLSIPYEKRYQNFIANPLWKGKWSKVEVTSQKEKRKGTFA